jgi:hypothetical protein
MSPISRLPATGCRHARSGGSEPDGRSCRRSAAGRNEAGSA